VAQSGVNLGLRGCKEAKIDDKGRLKLPTSFRADIEATWNTPSVYLTCDDAAGQYVRIYPMPVWEGIEERLLKMPSTDPARRKFTRWTSFWGQADEIDGQGRLLIQPHLRESAAMQGDVVVLAQSHFLEVWNRERFVGQTDALRLNDDDYRRLAEFQI
jgi:MraZ protein